MELFDFPEIDFKLCSDEVTKPIPRMTKIRIFIFQAYKLKCCKSQQYFQLLYNITYAQNDNDNDFHCDVY